MADDLRTRIAAVMRAEVAANGLDSPVEDWIPFLTDAVIREIGLRREIRYTPPVPRMPRLPTGYRYVTEWETDDKPEHD